MNGWLLLLAVVIFGGLILIKSLLISLLQAQVKECKDSLNSVRNIIESSEDSSDEKIASLKLMFKNDILK